MIEDETDRYLAKIAAHPIDGDNLRTVLASPRFWRLTREHYGHTGPCVQTGDLGACWQYEVGISIRVGHMEWFTGATIDEAVRKAAAAIKKAERG